MPEQFGILLGTGDVVHFRVADFLHFYRRVKREFLALAGVMVGGDAEESVLVENHGLAYVKLLNLFCRLAEHESRPASHPVAEE
jgi:hypothetical protein